MKVAKLVLASILVRVIVDDSATDEQIVDAAKAKVIDKAKNELYENIEEIMDDKEVPFGKAASDFDQN